jgi:hypothetical protein
MEIERDRKRRLISLGQADYVSEILYRFSTDESHAVTTPVAMGTRLETTVDPDEHFDTTTYQSGFEQAFGAPP